MKKNVFVRWLCLLLLIATVVGVTVVSAAEPTPVADDVLILEDMAILVPANPTEIEKSAAKELKNYLQVMTGTSPAIYVEGSGYEPAIYVGATEYAKAQNVTYTDNNGLGEGWALKAVDGNLVIAGGAKRGVLYGVYHLLEDQLGVRWWNYWEDYIPQVENATLPKDFSDSGEPHFAYREIYSGTELANLFMVHNRANGAMCATPVAYGGDEEYGRPYHVHSIGHYFQPFYSAPGSDWLGYWHDAINPDGVSWFLYDDPNSSNPDGTEGGEFFAWNKARQERVSAGQVCLTNESLIELLKEKVLIAIELTYAEADKNGVERPIYFDISPNDAGYFCECPTCEASTETYGPSGHLLRFVNQIARHVKEYYPEVIIETLGYSDYVEPPKKDAEGNFLVVPESNMMIRLADSAMDILQDLWHPNNIDGALERMRGWGEACQVNGATLIYWDYGLAYATNGVFPSQFRYQSHLQELDKNNGRGYFLEMEDSNHAEYWDMKVWMICKLMEDPYQDEKALMMDFLDGYYGDAAGEYLYDYLTYMHEKTELYDELMLFSTGGLLDAEWLDAEDIIYGHECYENAVDAIKSDPTLDEVTRELYINRIQAARAPFDRVILYNHEEYVQEMAEKGSFFGIGREETGVRMVNAVQWLIEMERELDFSGVQNIIKRINYAIEGYNIINDYAQYLEEIEYATGEVNKRQPLPQQVLDDHPNVDTSHIYDFTAESFRVYSDWYDYLGLEKNEASYPGGYAATLDYAKAIDVFEQDGRGERALNSFKVTEKKALTTSFGDLRLNKPLIADGEYHLYRLEDTVLFTKVDSVVKFFGSGAIALDMGDMEYLGDQKVDIYLSMKITGDPSGEDPNFLPKYYIDRLIIVEPCSVHNMKTVPYEDATCTTNATEIGTCPLCGDTEAIKELYGTKLLHNIEGEYTYDPQTKAYSAYCSTCDSIVSFDVAAELPQDFLEELKAAGLTLERVYDFGADSGDLQSAELEFRKDPQSAMGTAVMADTTNMDYDTAWKYLVTDKKAMQVSTTSNGLGTITYDQLQANNGDGYHLYKLSDAVITTGSTSYLWMWQWYYQNRTIPTKLVDLANKPVDVYVSIKTSGKIDLANGDTTSERPVFYVDRFIIVDKSCAKHFPAGDYTYNPETDKYEAQCANCLSKITLDIAGKLPQQVIDDVKAAGLSLAHVHDYSSEDFHYATDKVVKKADSESSLGQAAVLDLANKTLFPDVSSRWSRLLHSNLLVRTAGGETGLTPLTLTKAQVSANSDTGYHLYKADDVVLFAEGNTYLYLWQWDLQNHAVIKELPQLADQKVDFYFSLKTTGDVGSQTDENVPAFYIDRMIVVDQCEYHLTEDKMVEIAPATCDTGIMLEGICPICGKVETKQKEGTALGHLVTGNYTWDAAENAYTADCERDGCSGKAVYENVKAQLPDEILDDLEATGAGMLHVREFGAEDLQIPASSGWVVKTDSTSSVGKSIYYDAATKPFAWRYQSIFFVKLFISDGTSNVPLKDIDGVETYWDKVTVQANATAKKGYVTYKFEDVKPENGIIDLWDYSNTDGPRLNVPKELKGKVLDLYVSMKAEGDVDQFNDGHKDLPKFSIDRVIMVDSCENYIAEDAFTPISEPTCQEAQKLTAKCPVCYQEYTKDGEKLDHSFTRYIQHQWVGGGNFVAECDYGCGATDSKQADTYTYDFLLEQTDSPVDKEHVIQIYDYDDFMLYGTDYDFIWDDEIDRPVVTRDRAKATSGGARDALNMTKAASIGATMQGSGHYNRLGGFPGSLLASNANDGYHWYSIKGSVPITADRYTYFFMFGDYGFQIHAMDDDLLRDYRNKPVDIYMRLKVTGDPYCVGEEPCYYFDMFITATACQIDDTWTIDKEASCSELGEAHGFCQICQKDSTASIPKTAHTIKNGVLKTKATCKQNAIESGYCSVCGAAQLEQQVPGTQLTHKFTNYHEDSFGKIIAYCDHGCGARDIQGVVDEHEIETGDPSTPSETPVKDFIQNLIPEDLQNMIPEENQDMLLPSIVMAGSAGESYGGFRDVSTSDWFYDEVMEAKANGLIDGVTANEFRPNENLTVAQAVKLAAALHQMYFRGGVTLTNGYVNWYDTYVAYAVENGIVGSEFSTYGTDKMNSVISRTDFVAIFAKALDAAAYTGCNNVADNAIPDVKMTDKNAQAIYTFYRAGILTGSDAAGTFNPTSSIKRSEVAAILIRMYDESARKAISLG